jgi:hypothetical protein
MDDTNKQAPIKGADDDVTIEVDGVRVEIKNFVRDVKTESSKAIFSGHRIEVCTDGGSNISLKSSKFYSHINSDCCNAAFSVYALWVPFVFGAITGSSHMGSGVSHR